MAAAQAEYTYINMCVYMCMYMYVQELGIWHFPAVNHAYCRYTLVLLAANMSCVIVHVLNLVQCTCA